MPKTVEVLRVFINPTLASSTVSNATDPISKGLVKAPFPILQELTVMIPKISIVSWNILIRYASSNKLRTLALYDNEGVRGGGRTLRGAEMVYLLGN